ncbi:lycopene cyclase [Amycolatopsis vastitatis]|uniref:Lycopene cyclase n=1 Tax=Amycolatopsis vastitatis TaxID=1905142 RepID=A0A229SK96_9PSEU|nr:lycopene cyclase [Amycolatopsis vastitatis]
MAIVGAGASGTLTAIRLLTEATKPIEVLLIDPAEDVGRGVAYSTGCADHLLNVPAGKLDALDGDPGHFARWAGAATGDYLPRTLFGRYLGEALTTAVRSSRSARLRRVRDRVVGVRVPNGVELTLSSGNVLRADAAVLALGVFPPSCDWAPEGLRSSPRFVRDPWAPGALDRVPGDTDVLLVGTGLTMADMALALDRPDRAITAVSRHGLLPRRHVATPAPAVRLAGLNGRDGLNSLHRTVTGHIRACLRDGRGWRAAVDSLRPHTAATWRNLPRADQERFLSTYLRYWDVRRHRMPPAVADRLRDVRAAGRLRIRRAEVLDAVAEEDGIDVTFTDGRRLRVGAVVNCTGPRTSLRDVRDPLLESLLNSALAVPGPHGFGLGTGEDGRLSNHPLWTLGSLRIGELWETTAIPEIREQAGLLAAEILSFVDMRRRPRPRDRYGLALSTGAEAAEAFNEGLDRVLLGRDGAIERMTAATEADPGFGLAHAAIALLEYESDAGVRLGQRLRFALDAVRGDERERAFVAAVAERIACPSTRGAALLKYIGEFPRDALAISVAVPTIAFGGLTHSEQSWALIERLGRTFGGDWWYRGQLAFVRQEQGRWDEAESLAAAALAEQPASGHAVHARTHVLYENGMHREGLTWLDGWIRDWSGEATGRAHFAWHAALHELMLGDGAAVLSRYARQLAPGRVTGPRALVDSGSLIWRCAITRRWTVGHARRVLDVAPPDWLTRPPTSFAALHAAVALAAAHDVDALRRLRRYAAVHESVTYRRAIAPACAGMVAVLEQRWATAISELESACSALGAVGGSLAQREVVEETLLYALISAERAEEAARLLSARLDRRPSPLDRDRLMELPRCR